MDASILLSQDADQDLLFLDVGPDITLDDLKAVIAIDTNVPADRQVLFHKTEIIPSTSQTLRQMQIEDEDVVVMQVKRAQVPGSAPQRHRAEGRRVQDDAEILRLQALGEPRVMEQLRQHMPELADAVHNSQQFRELWVQMRRGQDEAQLEKDRTIARLNADPFDVEAQTKIAEMIRENAVEANVTEAMRNTPEAFGRVHMLYIPVEVNRHEVKAFVDSGAQATIMSPECATKCGIAHLLDTRFAGIARGVGTAKILGRVHAAQIKIGSLYLSCSFTVMEGKDVDLLLGLDMLKRHQASIDLRKGALVIMDEEIPFLGEADIPKSQALFSGEPTVEGPGGMQVGGRSGAIMAPSTEEITSSDVKNVQGQGLVVGGSSGQASQSTRAYPAADVTQLMNLGFSREEVLQALQAAGGNVEVAAGILYPEGM
ncbi:DNA damage-inducible protein 1 [Lambiella insularis]|nr:DNA damage-inducible protein 1 [Lambiella insularis]